MFVGMRLHVLHLCGSHTLQPSPAAQERGTYWGMWNIAHNLGGFAAPLVAGTAARIYGWSWGMWAPGMIGLIMGCALLLSVRDSPESVGFRPVEMPKKKDPPKEKADASGNGTEQKEMTLLENLYRQGRPSRMNTVVFHSLLAWATIRPSKHQAAIPFLVLHMPSATIKAA